MAGSSGLIIIQVISLFEIYPLCNPAAFYQNNHENWTSNTQMYVYIYLSIS